MSKRKKEYAIDVLKREIEERKMKLKPCPFCNGEAEVDCRLGMCSVVCKDCGARVSSFGDVNPAIEAWNTRVDVEE